LTPGSHLRLSRCGVNYPANTWTYWRSRRLRVATLSCLLTDAAADCTEQRFVLVGISQGTEVICRDQDIAEALLISAGTVRSHLDHIRT